jgi:sugar phosphate isomerase/epimerase
VSGATLSLSSNCFPPGRLGESLECTARLGVAGVELGPRDAVVLAESAEEFRAAGAAFERLNLARFSVHAWTEVEGLGEVCPFAERFGCGLIVVHSPPEKLDADFAGQVRELTAWDKWCRERDIVLTVENSSMQRCAQFAELFAAVPGLRLTLDVKHAYKPEKLGTTHRDFLSRLAGRLANFHISGVNRAREELGDGCPPSDADNVDWREFGKDLAARGYSGIITAELVFPRHLSDAELQIAYRDLGGPEPEFPTLMHRLARNGVRYFREALGPALAGPGR